MSMYAWIVNYKDLEKGYSKTRWLFTNPYAVIDLAKKNGHAPKTTCEDLDNQQHEFKTVTGNAGVYLIERKRLFSAPPLMVDKLF